jgi:5-methyltetrahydrofolate--homocysteine methyltransferase
VLATVRGDVHDIGKNLVDIILTNNGCPVVNLGIRQTIGSILDAAAAHGSALTNQWWSSYSGPLREGC